jgi:hypothetical protein
MDITRIRREVAAALLTFPNVEVYPDGVGGLYVKALLQSSIGTVYFVTLQFPNYPNEMPKIYITKPDLGTTTKHRYNSGNICYLHPTYWNPGRHDVTFVLGRAAKWLNKFEVFKQTGRWPGAELAH